MKKQEKMLAPEVAPNRKHDFSLVLGGAHEITTELEDALDEAGCTDATLTMQSGRLYLTFARRALTLKDAILSAIRDVERASAITSVEIVRVDDCNLVTQADIARRMQRSRQLVHQYMTGERGPGNFPSPACYVCDDSPLWYWCEVAHWLFENHLIKEEMLREAEYIAMINTALELKSQQRLSPRLAKEVLDVLGSKKRKLAKT